MYGVYFRVYYWGLGHEGSGFKISNIGCRVFRAMGLFSNLLKDPNKQHPRPNTIFGVLGGWRVPYGEVNTCSAGLPTQN